MIVPTGRLETSLVAFAAGALDSPRPLLQLDEIAVRFPASMGESFRRSLDSSTSPVGLAHRVGSLGGFILKEWSESRPLSCAAILVAPTLACVMADPEVSHERAADAIAVGGEVSYRLADWIRNRSGSDWWDHALTAAGVGSVLALSRISGLKADDTVSALGLVATQAPTFNATSSPSLRQALAGKIAPSVVEAVLAAREGIGGPPDPVSGSRGLLSALANRSWDSTEITDGLGTEWRLARLLDEGLACPWQDCTCEEDT